MSTYEPGTVAVATVRGVPNVRIFRYSEASWVSSEPVMHTRVHHVEHVTDVRPLVVLDFDAAELSPTVAVREIREVLARDSLGWPKIADQIEQQTRPPKPAEPGKYGAVIAGDGREWFRYTTSEMHGRDWCRPGTSGGTEYATWDDLDVVRVTNEGQQP